MSFETSDIRTPKYEERYVAFVDILGFRGIIDRITKGAWAPEVVLALLRKVHEPPRLDKPNPELGKVKIVSGGFRAQSISDAVVLSADLEPWGLYHICYSISELAVTLLQEGIFIRGAITRGMLYHDDKTVFGQGLVKAYDFESKIASVPRVVITRDVVTDIEIAKRIFPYDSNFRNTLQQAEDGPMYLNVLEGIANELLRMADDNLNSISQLSANSRYRTIDVMRDNIQDEFDSSTDDPQVFQKIQWFAAYWNRVIPGRIMSPITGPGVAPRAFQ
jgi:hypothetical protein